MQESILLYRNTRFLWVATGLCVAAALIYFLYEPAQPRNGGTWVGYTLGTIGAVLIVWLTLFGVRERSYSSTLGSVEAWLSAHVYLGASLLIVATLHAGFQFGWNVHSLAYFLMLAVIASGVYGVYTYVRYPSAITRNRAGMTREQMLDEVADLDRKSQRVASKLPGEVQELISSAINRTELGGSAWAQLNARDYSSVVLPGAGSGRAVSNANQEAAQLWLVDLQSRSTNAKQSARLQELCDMLGTKQLILARLRLDIRFHARLQIWLYIHVPLSFALIGALIAHIVSVFLYW